MTIYHPRTLRGWLALPWRFVLWLWALIARRTTRHGIQVKLLSQAEAREMRRRERLRAMSIRHWCARHEGRGFQVKPAVPIDPRWFWYRDIGAADRDETYEPLWRLARRPLAL